MKIIARMLVIVLITFCFTIAASAVTFVVNTASDTQDANPGDGICSDGSNCSMRAAITEANALAGADIITVGPVVYNQTLVAANEDLNAGGDWDITSQITINGVSEASTIMQPVGTIGTASERVFNVRAGGNLTLTNMTVRNGNFSGTMAANTRGAGIENLGILTLDHVTVRDNRVTSTSGNPIAAGISNQGTAVTLLNSTVTANITTRSVGILNSASAFGGGMASLTAATLVFTNSSISGNSAITTATFAGFGFGAGLYLENVFNLTATNSHFDNNTGTGVLTGGGSNGNGIRALSAAGAASLNLTNCTVSNNVGTGTGTSHQGTGLQLFTVTTLAATLTVTLDRTTLNANTAPGNGLGISSQTNGGNMTVNVLNSTISNHTTGLVGSGVLASNTGSTLAGVTVYNFTNSTISGNVATGPGGGFAMEQPNTGTVTANFNYSTIANNRANNDNTGATDNGGGIIRASGTLNLKNTIVADNSVGTGSTGPDISGAVNSQDFNHIEDLTGATVTGTTANNTTGDPQLGALGSNGGPTQTHLPNLGSPVINTIPNGVSDCGTTVTIDQRLLPRPVGGSCDKGSTERVAAVNNQHFVDYDGDGKTDYSITRNISGQVTWFNLNSGGTTQITAWGSGGDFVVPGDYDGDNKTDIAIWRPSTGGFYAIHSATGTFRIETFGQTGDDSSVVGDYDGDGKDDIAVWRPSNGTWYWRTTAGGPVFAVQWGQNGDAAVPGDYDGDGKSDFVVQRDAGGGQARFWRLFATGSSDSLVFGATDDVVVPGDYDGDGKTDIATVRNSGGQLLWWIHPSGGGADAAQFWGNATPFDHLTPGDYDGDGKTDIAIWRANISDPTQNFYYVLGSTSGFFAQEWGESGDIPVAGYNVHF
ncbi:MAG TPA: VCBS repeat-containing protein [Pyrinomonadaceae bacterium]|nr:VCBS repeat-containing protein [Pyrinomonadaceae bacterium]